MPRPPPTADAVRTALQPLERALEREIPALGRVFASARLKSLLSELDLIKSALDAGASADASACARTLAVLCASASADGGARRRAGAAESACACAALGGWTRGDDAADAEARAALLRAACDAGEWSDNAEGRGEGSASDRARCGIAATRFATYACADVDEDEDEGGDDGEGTSTAYRARGEELMYATRAVFHVAMIAEDENARRAAKTALTQIINATFTRADRAFEALAAKKRARESGGDVSGRASAETSAETSPRLRDVSLLLVMLCKIAAREGPVDVDAYLTHSRALALDILRQLMEGPRASLWLENFHDELRQPLSMALMRNALVQVPRGSDAEQSVGILVSIARMAYGTLIHRARSSWKQQIAALYPMMALHPLESDEASPAMRVAALRLVRRLASDAQILVDFFVNYDCDLHAANLYERTVVALARAAQTSDVLERDAVLTCLFSMLRSLQSWHARGDEGRDEDGNDENEDADDERRRRSTFELRPGGPRPSRSGGASVAVAAATATVAVDVVASALEETTISSSTSVSIASPSPSYQSEAERFQAKKSAKVSVERAIEAFNADPNVQTLRQAARTEDATGCALFLRRGTGLGGAAQTLSPQAIGELLGAHDAEALAVMRAYVHDFDFSNTHIDDAMRAFLGGFKLPGEAQKIDRLMEAFASRFCACNHDAYPSADSAYILAFAIVMLNTDAHNPLTETAMKMSEQDFVLMVTAAEAASELDADAIAAIYRRVSANEIKMNVVEPPPKISPSKSSASPSASGALVQALNFAAPWKLRSTLKEATDETAAILKSTKELFKRFEESPDGRRDAAAANVADASSGATSSLLFVHASESGLARPMLDAAGKCMLAALSTAFEAAPDEAHAAMPLEATRAMLSLATSLQLPALRDDIRDFLIAAPGFGRPQGIATQCKEALSTLLELAASECNLGGVQAWASVLEVIDRLERARAIVGAGVAFDFAAVRAVFRAPLDFAEPVTSEDASATSALPTQLTPAELAVTKWLSTSGGEAIERVFALSTRFDSDEILAYATAVVTVSRHGLWNSDGSPRVPAKVFALLRLTEVAATNMSRVRLVWSKLWSVVAEHLVESVKHSDEKVVLHATVSMRQVADRLLLRARATRSATQVDAMRPFVFAIENVQTSRARGLVTSCVAQALQNFGDVLGLGWEPAMEVLEAVYGSAALSRVEDTETLETQSKEMRVACRAIERAIVAALERCESEASSEDEDTLGMPLSFVPRAMTLFVALARWSRARVGAESASSEEESVASPLSSLTSIARSTVSRLISANGESSLAKTSTFWAAACAALGAIAREDDEALEAMFALFDDDEIERLTLDARLELARAIDSLLEVKIDPKRATEFVLPRLLALARARRAAYDAVLSSIWSFSNAVLHSAVPHAVAATLIALRDAADVASAHGDASEETWSAMCRVLRNGVVVDAMMLDLPQAGDVVNRSLACIAACDDVRKSRGIPVRAKDEILDIIANAYGFARKQNDARSSLGTLARLEFVSGDALLRALSEDASKKERFIAHVSRCLAIATPDEDKENEFDGKSPDAGDATLRSNALAPARERLAARALTSVTNDHADDASVSALAAGAVAALRVARRAPLSEALADFLDAPATRAKLRLNVSP